MSSEEKEDLRDNSMVCWDSVLQWIAIDSLFFFMTCLLCIMLFFKSIIFTLIWAELTELLTQIIDYSNKHQKSSISGYNSCFAWAIFSFAWQYLQNSIVIEFPLFTLTVYGVEATLKIIGLGILDYLSSGWNVFDLTITILAALGIIAEQFANSFFYVIILRPLR